jgi:hypothetical protein
VKFRFPEPPHSGKVMLVASELSKSYGGPAVFSASEIVSSKT